MVFLSKNDFPVFRDNFPSSSKDDVSEFIVWGPLLAFLDPHPDPSTEQVKFGSLLLISDLKTSSHHPKNEPKVKFSRYVLPSAKKKIGILCES